MYHPDKLKLGKKFNQAEAQAEQGVVRIYKIEQSQNISALPGN
jgi:hypothetical protein